MSRDPVSAEIVFGRILQTALDEVSATEADALADAPDGVHRHRVSMRRARAVLGALRGVAEPGAVEPLRLALREWGAHLGEVRDAEVRAAQAEAALEGVDDADARRRLVDEERREYRRLHARLRQLAEGPRAQRRRRLVREGGRAMVRQPGRTADETLGRMLRREARRVRRAAAVVAAAADDAGALERSHELRKAGRRLRYVAEAVEAAAPGLLGAMPRQLAESGGRIHSVLGAYRDLMQLAARAARVRTRAVRAGESAAAYDTIIRASRARAALLDEEVPAAVRRVRRAARRRGDALGRGDETGGPR